MATEAVNIPTKMKINPVNRLAVLSSKNKQAINVAMNVKIALLLPLGWFLLWNAILTPQEKLLKMVVEVR